MASIRNRHIRHDWQTFVDWEQKSVRTMCGVTTKRHLAGIPTVTTQDIFPEIDGKPRFGWCTRCVQATMWVLKQTEDQYMLSSVKTLYAALSEEIFPEYEHARVLEQKRRDSYRRMKNK